MRNPLKLSLIIVTIIIMTSCSGPYTINDNGTTVNLSIDDPFEIDLAGNASTGYIWQVLPFDSTVIKQVGTPSSKVNNDDRVGSSSVKTYRFITVADGETNLKFVYRRRWEENEIPTKTFEMKIVVGTMGRILEE